MKQEVNPVVAIVVVIVLLLLIGGAYVAISEATKPKINAGGAKGFKRSEGPPRMRKTAPVPSTTQ